MSLNTDPTFSQKLNHFIRQFNTQGSPQFRLQSSGWWYEPESECVHITYCLWSWPAVEKLGKIVELRLVASRPKSQAKYEGKASFANLCSCCCQQHHGQRHPPGTTAGICGIQKLWFSSGNVIGPSHHLGPLEECA